MESHTTVAKDWESVLIGCFGSYQLIVLTRYYKKKKEFKVKKLVGLKQEAEPEPEKLAEEVQICQQPRSCPYLEHSQDCRSSIWSKCLLFTPPFVHLACDNSLLPLRLDQRLFRTGTRT